MIDCFYIILIRLRIAALLLFNYPLICRCKGMIFGLGSAAIFYITTGQCYHDIKSFCVKVPNSGRDFNNSNGEEDENPGDERQLLLEQGDPTIEKSGYGS